MRKCELLAPCGSVESVYAALYCGADAIYIGLKSFSARQNAVNFDYSELDGVISLCHLFGAKVYVAVNTVVFDSQYDELKKSVVKCAKLGVDAFIVQDLGVARFIKSILPEMPLHASTQMTIHTPQGALQAKKLGFKRVVVSRELNAEQIAKICKTGIEVEAFVHGALCMCVSGQCYMSAMFGTRSANRGLCAQPCRLPFSAKKGDSQSYALSLKDLSLIEHIDKLRQIGVCSLKIEGRMKRPEYVAAAVSAYRSALDGKTYDINVLQSVFSRQGFTDGYFKNRLSRSMFGIRDYESVTQAAQVLDKIKKEYIKLPKKYCVDFLCILENDMLEISAVCGDIKSMSSVDISQYCEMKPLENEVIQKQLSRLGNTVFEAKSVGFGFADNSVKCPISTINSMRREIVENISNKIISSNTSHYQICDVSPEKISVAENTGLKIRCAFKNAKQFLHLDENAKQSIEFAQIDLREIENNLDDLKTFADKIVISPPRFLHDETAVFTRIKKLLDIGFSHLYCNNVAYFAFTKKARLHGGFGLNTANSYSVKALADIGLADVEISFEAKLSTAHKLPQFLPLGIVAYGKLPLMMNVNCPIGNCKNCKGRIFDRKGEEFEIICPKENEGYAEILNSRNLELSDKLSELIGFDFIKLVFFDETAEQIEDILKRYTNGAKINTDSFTRGLYYRGVQ